MKEKLKERGVGVVDGKITSGPPAHVDCLAPKGPYCLVRGDSGRYFTRCVDL